MRVEDLTIAGCLTLISYLLVDFGLILPRDLELLKLVAVIATFTGYIVGTLESAVIAKSSRRVLFFVVLGIAGSLSAYMLVIVKNYLVSGFWYVTLYFAFFFAMLFSFSMVAAFVKSLIRP